MGFHHHGDHVKADENYDYNIKGLACYNVEKEPLVSVLEEKKYIQHQLVMKVGSTHPYMSLTAPIFMLQSYSTTVKPEKGRM